MADDLDVIARARFLSTSPQKVRLVLDLIRGNSVNQALHTLNFTASAASQPVSKLLNSAIANAEQNFGFNRDNLVIHRAFADEGPTRRWRRFGARLRFKPIQRRYSHMTLILRESVE
jgi:large subunit ribosomal protein L22